MRSNRGKLIRDALAAFLVVVTTASAGFGASGVTVQTEAIQVAQVGGTEPRELEPRYKPVQPEEKSWYNSSYIFGLTRGVAGSTMVPAAKAPLFLFTVPLDLVLLPAAAIGGLFG
jgi:hypothetical protein